MSNYRLESPESFSTKEMAYKINGQHIKLDMLPSRRLITILREDLALTGTKVSCEIGRCGACMVLVNGLPVNACLTMAYQCADKTITTIEGIAPDGGLSAVQQAFLEEGGFQCGYCTAGMIVSATALLRQYPLPTNDQIEEALSGNLCRCTGYGGIVRAVHRAAEIGRDAT